MVQQVVAEVLRVDECQLALVARADETKCRVIRTFLDAVNVVRLGRMALLCVLRARKRALAA